MLEGFGPRIIAVNRSGNPVEGADETYSTSDIERVWPAADYFVALAPLTEQTRQLLTPPLSAPCPITPWSLTLGAAR